MSSGSRMIKQHYEGSTEFMRGDAFRLNTDRFIRLPHESTTYDHYVEKLMQILSDGEPHLNRDVFREVGIKPGQGQELLRVAGNRYMIAEDNVGRNTTEIIWVDAWEAKHA